MKGEGLMKRVFLLSIVGLFLITNQVSAVEKKVIKDGSVVKFDYTLYVEGEVADTSEGKAPLEYTQGTGMIIPGLEKQMAGLTEGEEKTIVVASEDAYGPVNPQAIVEIPKTNIGEDIKPEKGMVLQMQTKDGQMLNGTVTEIKEDVLVMNFNHPLAGKELKFNIKVVAIQ